MRFNEVIREINLTKIKEYVHFFSSLDSRMTGYPGFYQAANYIYEKFRELGLDPGPFGEYWQNFSVTVPIDYGSNITVLSTGETINVLPLFPNYIQTCKTPPGGLTGRLVYAAKGDLSSFNGREINGTIVLMDFESGSNWLNAAKLGAKAVIFLSSTTFSRFESEQKFCMAPIYFPRLYVPRADESQRLKELAAENALVCLQSDVRWQTVRAQNIIGTIPGQTNSKEVLIVGAHYDSTSITLGMAPGADDSTAIAILLEMARFFVVNKPSITIWFVAFAGHWQGLAGAREFVDSYFFNPYCGNEYYPFITVTLDFSTDVKTIGIFKQGFFNGMYADDSDGRYSGIRRRLLTDYLSWMREQLPDGSLWSVEAEGGLVFNVGLMGGGRGATGETTSWDQGMPFAFMFDAEAIQLAGPPAVGFLSTRSYRTNWKTPLDTYDKVNFENLLPQLEFTACMLYGMANEPSLKDNVVLKGWPIIAPTRRFSGAYYGFGFANLRVQVRKYNVTSPTLYSPLPHALVVVKKSGSGAWYQSGIANTYNPDGWIIAEADDEGIVNIKGVAADVSGSGWPIVEAWKLDQDNGQILYAPDMGIYGSTGNIRVYAPEMGIDHPVPIVSFECGSFVLFDMIEPRSYQKSIQLDSYRTPTIDLTSRFRFVENPVKIFVQVNQFLQHSPPVSWGFRYDELSNVLIVFVPPSTKFEVIVKMMGMGKMVAVLVNASKNWPEGFGYILQKPGETLSIQFSPLYITEQLFTLNDGRLMKSFEYNVISPSAKEYHEKSAEFLSAARSAIKTLRYDEAYSLSLLAWSWEVRAYEETRSLMWGVSETTVFFILLLIPFSFVLERLCVEAKTGKFRFVATSIILAIMVAAFAFLHPSFHVASNSIGAIIGLTIGVLAFPLVALIFERTASYAREVRRKVAKLHIAEMSRTSALVFAMSMGLSHMKRRKFRTLLTIVSTSLITLSLISLTSVAPFYLPQKAIVGGKGPYEGLQIRTKYFDPISPQLLSLIKGLLPPSAKVVTRFWLYTWGSLGGFVIRGPKGDVPFTAIVSLSQDDAPILKSGLLEGRWFEKSDLYTCMITQETSMKTGLKVGDTTNILGINLTVVGILDGVALNQARDMDQKPFTPIEPQSFSADPERPSFLAWDNLLTIPEALAEILPGSHARVVEVIIEEGSRVEGLASTLALSSDQLFIYISTFEGTKLYARVISRTFFGYEFLPVPLFMAALLLFNTMLGSIYERRREVEIFACIGLSPLHVMGIFLSETMAYAVLSGIIGYIGGLAFSAVLFRYNLLPGFLPNYASTFVVIAVGIAMLMTISSGAYPLFRAGSLVTPSLERKWRVPSKPIGDTWNIPLPFTFMDEDEVMGVFGYLQEFLLAHKVEGVGAFVSESVSYWKSEEAMVLRCTMRLPPYELNILQEVDFSAYLKEKRYALTVQIRKLSGMYQPWVSSNLRLMSELRKQLLMWSSLPPAKRQEYTHMAMTGMKTNGV
jgi:hypothetical protein